MYQNQERNSTDNVLFLTCQLWWEIISNNVFKRISQEEKF